MDKLIERIERKQELSKINWEDIDIIVSVKNNWMGFFLGSEFVILNSKKQTSFRIKIGNLGDEKVCLKKSLKSKIDKYFLTNYFKENEDNPYSIQFIFSLISWEKMDINKENVITQFPPIKRKLPENQLQLEFQTLINKAEIGDCLFCFNRTSKMSSLISKVDYCQFSHCCMIYTSGSIIDLTTNGLIKHSILDYNFKKYNLALYRNINFSQIPIEERKNILEQKMNILVKYNWVGIFKAFLYRKYRFFRFLKSTNGKKDITLSDLLFSNQLKLIHYV